MSVQIEDGAVRVSVTYSLKVPDPSTPYAAEQVSLSTSLEFAANGDSEVVMTQARQLDQALYRDLQLSVFAHLGIEDFTELPNGRLVPKIPLGAEKPKKSGGGGGGYKGGGGGGGQRKADPSQIPQHTIQVNGEQITVQDLRGLKANGTYKQNAPDFRQGDRPIWIQGKDGNPNPEAQAIANAIDSKAQMEAPW